MLVGGEQNRGEDHPETWIRLASSSAVTSLVISWLFLLMRLFRSASFFPVAALLLGHTASYPVGSCPSR